MSFTEILRLYSQATININSVMKRINNNLDILYTYFLKIKLKYENSIQCFLKSLQRINIISNSSIFKYLVIQLFSNGKTNTMTNEDSTLFNSVHFQYLFVIKMISQNMITHYVNFNI